MLTTRDSDLLDYMKGLNLKTTTNNCAPQVFIKTRERRKVRSLCGWHWRSWIAAGLRHTCLRKRQVQCSTLERKQLKGYTSTPKRLNPPGQTKKSLIMLRTNEPDKIMQYIDTLTKQPSQADSHSHVINTSVFTVLTVGNLLSETASFGLSCFVLVSSLISSLWHSHVFTIISPQFPRLSLYLMLMCDRLGLILNPSK